MQLPAGWRTPPSLGGFVTSLVLGSCLLAAVLPRPGLAGTGCTIHEVRFFTAPEHTRVVLDLSRPGSFEVRRVSDPDRLAINVPSASFSSTEAIHVGDGLIRGIRCNRGNGRAQVVLDLASGAEFRSFSLPAAAGRYDRIVIDVLRPGTGKTSPAEGAVVASVAPQAATREFTVIIDPGHGGMDPGAIRAGINEKDVVLDVSRELVRQLNAMPGYRAKLTRTGDYGMELWEREAFARRNEGDLFLSVHCNTHPRSSVAGMEVYFLSLQGATDREAQELANKENAAQLVGLDPAASHDDLVMDILMDLRMSQVLYASARFAHTLLDAADQSGVVGSRRVKQARFRVLRSLAMPSALVEVAYLSNAEDRKLMKTMAGRRQIAGVLVEGILDWRRDVDNLQVVRGERPEHWPRKYKVRRGDSLWELARQYGTTVTEISRRNDLDGGAILVGQMLRLPEVYQKP